jgi:hypothetical protein
MSRRHIQCRRHRHTDSRGSSGSVSGRRTRDAIDCGIDVAGLDQPRGLGVRGACLSLVFCEVALPCSRAARRSLISLDMIDGRLFDS